MDDSLQSSIRNDNLYSNNHEYSIPKVSFDGEPHEIMTMVAAFSGIIAAIIVLVILIMLIGCGNPDRRREQQSTSSEQNSEITTQPRVTIIPIFEKCKSIDGEPNLVSISTIRNEGYDNPACDNDAENKDEIIIKVVTLPEIKTVQC